MTMTTKPKNVTLDDLYDLIVGVDGKLTGRIDGLEKRMEDGFAAIQQDFNAIYSRLDKIEMRLMTLEQRTDETAAAIAALKHQLNALYDSLDAEAKNNDIRDTEYAALVAKTDRLEKAIHLLAKKHNVSLDGIL